MKTLYKKAAHLRAHTWKDVGGIGGLLLDAAFFVFLLIVSAIVALAGLIAIALDYIFYPVIAFLSLFRRDRKKNWEEPTIPGIDKIGVPPPHFKR